MNFFYLAKIVETISLSKNLDQLIEPGRYSIVAL
jgi:hypothetical protein